MKPVKIPHNPQGDLFKTELNRIIDLSHPLVRLGREVDWQRLDELFGKTYDENIGRPGATMAAAMAAGASKLRKLAVSTRFDCITKEISVLLEATGPT